MLDDMLLVLGYSGCFWLCAFVHQEKGEYS